MMTLCGYLASAEVQSLRSFPAPKSFHLGSEIPYGLCKEYFGLWASILLEIEALLLRSAVPHQIMV